MRIAQVAPLQVSTPPKNYGGTERCIYNLTEALVRLGHDVTLFATGDSETSARLEAPLERAINFDPAVEAGAYHSAHLAEIYERAHEFDVIHSHLDYHTLPFAVHSQTPTAITLHGRLDSLEFQRCFNDYQRIIDRRHAPVGYVAISESQRSYLPNVNWVGTIHHAVNLERFSYFPRQGKYLAFVGRIAPEKRPDRAIEIAKMTGIPLKIAAKIDPKDREYYEREIKHLMDHPLIEYLGPVDELTKQEVMGKAMATVMPIDWPEPFGMVFIESLAVGTPVLTCPCGSVPELLKDGVTGFIRESTEELAACVPQLSKISRRGCREYVRKKFDVLRMALQYVNAYSALMQRPKPFNIATGEPTPEVLLS